MSRRACRACGCTDAHGCAGGCSWVEPDLCSACVGAGSSAAELKEGIAAAMTAAWIDQAYALPEDHRRLVAGGTLPEFVVDVLEMGPENLAARVELIAEVMGLAGREAL